MNTTFDFYDLFYLANSFTAPQLRHEIREAELKAKLQDYFKGTLYAETDSFPWTDYGTACREALAGQRPAPSPARIRAVQIDVAALKSRNDIVSVVEQYTPLRKSGHNRFIGRCPIHEDHSPSLTVYADNQSWHCFGCNKGGDVFDFIMAVNTCDFKQAAAILGDT